MDNRTSDPIESVKGDAADIAAEDRLRAGAKRPTKEVDRKPPAAKSDYLASGIRIEVRRAKIED